MNSKKKYKNDINFVWVVSQEPKLNKKIWEKMEMERKRMVYFLFALLSIMATVTKGKITKERIC